MTRRAMIFDCGVTAIIRGILSCILGFMRIALNYLKKILIPLGLVIAVFIMSFYVYSFIDEVILVFHECKKI